MDSVGIAGDDSPGLFQTGVVHDPRLLMDKALSSLCVSLLQYVSGSPAAKEVNPPGGFSRKSLLPFRHRLTEGTMGGGDPLYQQKRQKVRR